MPYDVKLTHSIIKLWQKFSTPFKHTDLSFTASQKCVAEREETFLSVRELMIWYGDMIWKHM